VTSSLFGSNLLPMHDLLKIILLIPTLLIFRPVAGTKLVRRSFNNNIKFGVAAFLRAGI
jgi:hypothetical protein